MLLKVIFQNESNYAAETDLFNIFT